MNQPDRPALRSWLGLIVLVALVWGASQGLSRWQDSRAASAIREHSQRVDITLYTTSTCPYCAQAMAWLKRHEVRWRECNVETDPACARTYAEQGSPGVPLVQAGERWHLGFHAPWLAEALAQQDNKAPRAITPSQPASPSGASSPRP